MLEKMMRVFGGKLNRVPEEGEVEGEEDGKDGKRKEKK